eukprot:3038149-Rhodomonas_salina.1
MQLEGICAWTEAGQLRFGLPMLFGLVKVFGLREKEVGLTKSAPRVCSGSTDEVRLEMGGHDISLIAWLCSLILGRIKARARSWMMLRDIASNRETLTSLTQFPADASQLEADPSQPSGSWRYCAACLLATASSRLPVPLCSWALTLASGLWPFKTRRPSCGEWRRRRAVSSRSSPTKFRADSQPSAADPAHATAVAHSDAGHLADFAQPSPETQRTTKDPSPGLVKLVMRLSGFLCLGRRWALPVVGEKTTRDSTLLLDRLWLSAVRLWGVTVRVDGAGRDFS